MVVTFSPPNDAAMSLTSPPSLQINPANNKRFARLMLKNISPEVRRAVEALWENYEALDLIVITTSEAAADDLLAAMPVIEGVEDEIRQMVTELVDDLRTNFKDAADMPLRLRFAYQNEDELIDQVLPRSAARLVVMPIDQDISLHTNIKEDN